MAIYIGTSRGERDKCYVKVSQKMINQLTWKLRTKAYWRHCHCRHKFEKRKNWVLFSLSTWGVWYIQHQTEVKSTMSHHFLAREKCLTLKLWHNRGFLKVIRGCLWNLLRGRYCRVYVFLNGKNESLLLLTLANVFSLLICMTNLMVEKHRDKGGEF